METQSDPKTVEKQNHLDEEILKPEEPATAGADTLRCTWKGGKYLLPSFH